MKGINEAMRDTQLGESVSAHAPKLKSEILLVRRTGNGFLIHDDSLARQGTIRNSDDMLVATSPAALAALMHAWGEAHFPPPADGKPHAPPADTDVVAARMPHVTTPMFHDFAWALAALDGGRTVARTGWNGKGMWLHMVRGSADGAYLPYIKMRTAQGAFVPWVASHTDLLARDWTLV